MISVLLLALCAASAQAQFTDYDRRAARVLFNTVKSGAVASKDKADPAKLDGPPRKEGNKAVYTQNIPSPDGKAMMSGYYRISVNTELSTLGEGWKDLGVDKATGAQVAAKSVLSTTADQYLSWGVRKKIGNVILTVAMRRPHGEDANAARADLLARYNKLFVNAEENQLFASVQLRITGGEPAVPTGVVGANPLQFGSVTSSAVKVVYAAEVVDSENNAIPGVKKLKIRLTGRLAKFAEIECKNAKKVGEVLEITDPQVSEEFTLIVKSNDPAFADALYQEAAADEEKAKTPLINVKVAAQFNQ
jgi:hypothetical protein